jgi:hypothetical protein
MSRVTIDFDTRGEQPAGSIVAGSEPPRTFAGWLELISRLEELSAAIKEESRAEPPTRKNR